MDTQSSLLLLGLTRDKDRKGHLMMGFPAKKRSKITWVSKVAYTTSSLLPWPYIRE